LRKRALWIVDRLEVAGKISAEEGDRARGEIEQLVGQDRINAEEADEATEEDH